MSNETPRTAAATKTIDIGMAGVLEYVPVEEVEAIERELAAANATIAKLRDALKKKASEWESAASWMGIPMKAGAKNITDCAADVRAILAETEPKGETK